MDFRQTPKSGWLWTDDWTKRDNDVPGLVYFRKVLDFDKAVDSFVVKVSADSRYRLYVNGHTVCAGPCKGDDMVWYYETVDIAEYLVQGKNIVSASVLRYPVDQIYNHSVWRTSKPGLYIEGSITYQDGQSDVFSTDGTWKSIKNRNFSIEQPMGERFLGINENTKGSAGLDGWTTQEYDDSEWYGVKEYGAFEMHKAVSPGGLSARPIPLLYEKPRKFTGVMTIRESAHKQDAWDNLLLENEPITVAANSREIIEINAGELTTGYLSLELLNGKDAQIKILCSEGYVFPSKDQDSRFPRPVKGNRIDHVNGFLDGFKDTYTVDGYGADDKPEVYEPFWFRTFRFIRFEITTHDEPVTIRDISYRETGYPLEVKTTAEASDPDFAGIWDISLRSLKRCMHETYEDCPFYEQLQYVMDTRSQILFTYMTSGDDRMARRTIDDYHRSLRPDGMINCCYPSFGPNIIPSFSLYYILIIHDHMMYFGDKELIRRYLPTVDAILEFFNRAIDERGIVSRIGGPLGRHKYWSFIDWVNGWLAGAPDAIAEGPITAESLLYAYVLKHASELAEFAGRPSLGEDYLKRSEAVKDAVNRHCIGASGLYQDGPGVDKYSQHAQVFAVLSGAVEGDAAKKIMEIALDDTSLAPASVAFAFYLFRAVELTGLYHRTEGLWAPWRKMLKDNLTTCVENDTDARSDCHAWGSLLLYELPAVILGVRPAKPGFAAAYVSPNPGYLDHAKGSVVTPKGMISVSWERTAAGIETKIDAPEGLEIIRD